MTRFPQYGIGRSAGPPGAGVPGAAGPPGVGASWQGVWSSGTTYTIGQGVYRNGVPYISNANGNINHDPAIDSGTNWGALASSGLQAVQVIHNAPHQPYAAVGDGTTDDGPVFQTFLNDMKTAGGGEGIIPIPSVSYKIATPVSVTGLQSCHIKAAAYATSNDTKPVLSFTGTGTTPALHFISASGVWLEGLNIQWTSSGFTGSAVKFEGGSGDCFRNKITGCGFIPAGTLSNGIGLSISSFLKGKIEDCDFGYGSRAIQWGDPSSAGGQYVNGTVLRDSSFANSASNPIYLQGADTEVCLFENLTFEPIAGGLCGGFEGNTSIIYENTWINMFMVEGAANGGTFMKSMYNAGRPCTIIGGEIGGEAGNGFGDTGSLAMDLRGNWTIIGTQFNGGPNAFVFGNQSANQFSLNWIGGGIGGGGTAPAFAGTLPAPFTAMGVKGYADTRPAVAQTVVRNQFTGFSPNNITAGMMGQLVEVTRGSGATVTVQAQSAAAFPIGGYVDIWNSNATTGGNVLMAASGTASILPATVHIVAGGIARITQVAFDVWAVTGDTV